MNGNLIILVGLPSSGKSTYAKEYFSKHDNCVVLSSDDIREKLFNNTNNKEINNQVFNIMKRLTIDNLKQGTDVIYDATNITSKRRANLLKELKKYYDKAICVFKYKPIDACIWENSQRDKVIPSDVIYRMYKTIDIPCIEEGFDSIIIDYNYERQKFGFKKEAFNFNDIRDYNYMLMNLNLKKCIGLSQDSKYHTLSLNKHMYFAYNYLKNNNINDTNLLIASMFHDIGKISTRTEDEEGRYCHYYGHEHVSAYDLLGILAEKTSLSDNDILDICMLVNYHMRLMNKTNDDKLKRIIGNVNYNRVLLLHNADTLAK